MRTVGFYLSHDCLIHGTTFVEEMKKEARALLQTARLRSDSREEIKIIKIPRVEIPPVLEPPLPPDLIVDSDDAQNNIKKEFRRPLKQPRVETPPILEPPLPPDLIFDRVEDPPVPSGDIPTRLSPSPLRPDSAKDENGGGWQREHR